MFMRNGLEEMISDNMYKVGAWIELKMNVGIF